MRGAFAHDEHVPRSWNPRLRPCGTAHRGSRRRRRGRGRPRGDGRRRESCPRGGRSRSCRRPRRVLLRRSSTSWPRRAAGRRRGRRSRTGRSTGRAPPRAEPSTEECSATATSRPLRRPVITSTRSCVKSGRGRALIIAFLVVGRLVGGTFRMPQRRGIHFHCVARDGRRERAGPRKVGEVPRPHVRPETTRFGAIEARDLARIV